MTAPMQQTLAELRDLDPVRRQTKLCNEWVYMKDQIVISKEKDDTPYFYYDMAYGRRYATIDEAVTPHGYGHDLAFVLFQDFDGVANWSGEGNPHFPIYLIQPETRHVIWNNHKSVGLPIKNEMAVFDRAGMLTSFFRAHRYYDGSQTYRVKLNYTGKLEPKYYDPPCYIFYRQEVAPPPWQWMLRKGTFLDDNLPPQEEAELCQKWGIHRVQANIFLLQVKWWHPFSLIKEVARLVLGGGTDLYIPIAHFLCALQVKEVSYHHSSERKKYESQWTKEDHERNKRLRGELYAMVDGLTVFNEEEPPKKKRRLQ